MINIVIVAALIAICALIIRYLHREKRKGGCVGCSRCGSGAGCGCHEAYKGQEKMHSAGENSLH